MPIKDTIVALNCIYVSLTMLRCKVPSKLANSTWMLRKIAFSEKTPIPLYGDRFFCEINFAVRTTSITTRTLVGDER
jgi:hypothetical protein